MNNVETLLMFIGFIIIGILFMICHVYCKNKDSSKKVFDINQKPKQKRKLFKHSTKVHSIPNNANTLHETSIQIE